MTSEVKNRYLLGFSNISQVNKFYIGFEHGCWTYKFHHDVIPLLLTTGIVIDLGIKVLMTMIMTIK